MGQYRHSFFYGRLRLLGIASAIYVVGLIISHATFPVVYVWLIAAFFSIAMNFTYLIEARSRGQFVRIEAIAAVSLISLSVAGLVGSPTLLIAAIFGHGCWDLLKHGGTGVPFFSWYTLGCATVDWLYSFALLWYWLTTT